MSVPPLNLGILAHVDAGKTSLTERLLFDHGAIPRLGSVDDGSTQTDSGALERQRGITIRSAVAAFALDDFQVNLIDTPGHPDFIAEVERALSVLDGVVLVISAVEGVQAQTRVLLKSVKRLGLPTLLFVNKIDRVGARYADLLDDIRRKLTPAIVPMVTVDSIGTRQADIQPKPLEEGFYTEILDLLADHDDELLRRVVEETLPTSPEIHTKLWQQTTQGLMHPVFFGSAISGAGITEFVAGVRQLLINRQVSAPDDRLRGKVFAIERTAKGEKIAYLRLSSGNLRERQRVTFHRNTSTGVEHYGERIAGIETIIANNLRTPSKFTSLTAGNIGKVRGLSRVRVGDQLGELDNKPTHFSPPILESIVRSVAADQQSQLHAALTQLADEDPLIQIRLVGAGAISVLLYGAVQQEVLAERLNREFGIDIIFEQAKPVYFERPAGSGEAVHQFAPRGPNDFWQTLGIRIEPARIGSGNSFVRKVQIGKLPRAYHQAIEDAATATLRQGLYGWEVTDCVVTITHIGYEAPMTTASDFRNLTPLVLTQSFTSAGSHVYEPNYHIEAEIPDTALSQVTSHLLSLRAELGQARKSETGWIVPAEIAAKSLHDLVLALPELTHGEGVLWYKPGSDRRVLGPPPTRERFDGNPLDHDEYMRYLSNKNLAR